MANSFLIHILIALIVTASIVNSDELFKGASGQEAIVHADPILVDDGLSPGYSDQLEESAIEEIGSTRETDREAQQSDPRIYLEETIPPCTLVTLEGRDPCEPRGTGSVVSNGLPASFDFRMTHPRFLDEAAMIGVESYLWTAHIAFRGTGLPGTSRCQDLGWSDHHFYVSPEKQKEARDREYADGGLIGCFIDFAVQEYLAGKGPPKLKVMVYSSFYSVRSLTYEEHEASVLNQVERAYSGYEWVMYALPSEKYHLEGFEMANAWDVQRNDTRPYASFDHVTNIARSRLDPRRFWTDDSGDPIVTDKHRARARREFKRWICDADICAIHPIGMEMTDLHGIQDSTRVHYQRLIEIYDGRIRPEPYYANILTDVHDLPLLMQQVGAYDHPHITPKPPPPAHGMLSSNAPQPRTDTARSASASRAKRSQALPDAMADISIALTWKPVPGAQKYRVEYKETDADGWNIHQDAIIDASHIVRGLECGIEYEFRTTAYGFHDKDFGDGWRIAIPDWGSPSTPITATTEPCDRMR